MCNRDCFRCTRKDCNNDIVTAADIKQQNEMDTEIIGSRKYGRSKVLWNYEHSEKGKARQKRYAQSEKGQAVQKRKTEKKIASGKNAEACKRYYYRKKAEREAQA